MILTKDAPRKLTHSEESTLNRNWQNTEKAVYLDCASPYDIPLMSSTPVVPDLEWIGFNFANTTDKEDRKQHGLHFYIDDYQFERLWANPDRYLNMLREFGAVMTPDFSVYGNYPKAIRIYNVYRNMWLARYWQDAGLTVIPTVIWGVEDNWDFCFDAYPKHSVISVTTQGKTKDKEELDLFRRGYARVLKMLEPTGVILHGPMIDGLEGNIIGRIRTLTDKIHRREGRGVAIDV